MKNGIAIAGTIVADVVKTIDEFPEKGMLTSIRSVSPAVGGCVPNTLIDLAKIDPTIPLYAYGSVGDDDYATFVCNAMKKVGINVDGVKHEKGQLTGFTDVMTVAGTGERTFFTMRGANSAFDPNEDFLFDIGADILHAGYILLADGFDAEDPEYGTHLARLLAAAQSRGIRTSVDVVSSTGNLFRAKVLPALRYCDYAIMNEIESCGAAGLDARDADGKLIVANVEKAIYAMFEAGVRDTVVVHCPEGGFICRRGGQITAVPSLDLPKGYIKGSVGAGDAFCAATLYGLYMGFDDEKILSFASAAAACNLSAADSVSGMKSRAEIEEMERTYSKQSW
ncbi:MAG: carbohydrate kinase family protein [Clostridia bacterium]|nr:carbohydrate kinase family protein [Clostridia bacterium]